MFKRRRIRLPFILLQGIALGIIAGVIVSAAASTSEAMSYLQTDSVKHFIFPALLIFFWD